MKERNNTRVWFGIHLKLINYIEYVRSGTRPIDLLKSAELKGFKVDFCDSHEESHYVVAMDSIFRNV